MAVDRPAAPRHRGKPSLPVSALEGQAAPQVTLTPLCLQDIILTVKEKLSIRSTEYFALALEEQYNISRLHLLHEEELIQQVPPAPAPGEEIWAWQVAHFSQSLWARGSGICRSDALSHVQKDIDLAHPGFCMR